MGKNSYLREVFEKSGQRLKQVQFSLSPKLSGKTQVRLSSVAHDSLDVAKSRLAMHCSPLEQRLKSKILAHI